MSEGLDGITTAPEMPDIEAEEIAKARKLLDLKPYRYGVRIPPRPALYGNPPRLWRRIVSGTQAPGGSGKTTLMVVEFISMAIGRDLLGHGALLLPRKLPVLLLNLEDDQDEMHRKIDGVLRHYNVKESELEKRLIVRGRDDAAIVIATAQRDGSVKIMTPLVRAMIEEIEAREIAAVGVDPLVSSHRVNENLNMEIDVVIKDGWRAVAVGGNCAVDLSHHTRKRQAGDNNPLTADDGRGAGALNNACRDVRVLNVMARGEAESYGITEGRKSFFWIGDDTGKANLSGSHSGKAWHRIVGVPIDNAAKDEDGERPADVVGVCTGWKPPAVGGDISDEKIKLVQDAMRDQPMRASDKAGDWIGHAIGPILGIDAESKTGRKQISTLVSRWITAGFLKRGMVMDRTGHERPVIMVGERTPDDLTIDL